MQSTAPALAQMADDEHHSATELVEVLHHSTAVRAAADYRMLQAASLIHDEREQDHLVRLAAELGEQSTSLANLERLAARAAAGQDPRARFGPNGLEAAIAEVGAALTVPPARAREFIEAGSVLRHQLPFIGATLGAGRIDLPRFLAVVRRTALCTPEKLDLLDKIIAADIESREPMSMARFLVMIDKHIATHDPAATRRRRELVDSERNISVPPDRHTPGQSRIGGSLPAEQAAAVDARLTAMAAAVHAEDPRTAAQRRADALVALAHGATTLDCRCETCTPDHDAADIDADAGSASVADNEPDETPSPCAPRPTFHIVVNLSSLLGLDDDPAFLDGQGILDADTARRLVEEARRTYIRPDIVAEPRRIDRYAPSKKLADQVRAGELCCSFPGCNNRAFHADVDHDIPFAQGGPTDSRNLKPLCRFHHRIKTFAVGWRDYHDPLGEVFFQSPAGHTYLGNAFTGRDLFGSLTRTGRPPDDAARRRIDALRARRATSIKRADKRAMDRWNAANPPPF
ncbi:HNH endonuclease signature motif containing protein [Gordonia sp. SL306]|uniref:HNH endonuclease signature motif containing protein n=1 Tax=Gordonia sp. SL306 TaxID=2995145 RepID=UPI00226F9BF0|nr:HNH endonuclease signature motif containing protein [Gordonia sp. SL306]WAC57735.1 DUF222 domain-containing protein [Gordonia sp. SL306]